MLLLFGALLDRGDEVVLSDPHYACYPNFVKFAEAEPVYVPVDEEDGFQLRPEAVRRRSRPRTQGHPHQLAGQSHRHGAVARADGGAGAPRARGSSPTRSTTA